MTKPNSTAAATGGSQPRGRRKRKRLAPSQKYAFHGDADLLGDPA